MIDIQARFRDAERMIAEERFKDACGALRPVLEQHLASLCSQHRVEPREKSIYSMLKGLSTAGAIDRVEQSKLLTWNSLGNAGSHSNQDKVTRSDAEYFMTGLAERVGISTDQLESPKVSKPKASRHSKTVVNGGTGRHESHEGGHFVVAQSYTRKEISAVLGGGIQDYLPHKDGQVVAACLTADLNPQVPDVVCVGNGPQIKRWARAFAKQGFGVPTFIKVKPNVWRHVGVSRVRRLSDDLAEIESQKVATGRSDIAYVMHLKKI